MLTKVFSLGISDAQSTVVGHGVPKKAESALGHLHGEFDHEGEAECRLPGD